MIGRFLSPDPLMDPGDPKTLDPYRYADNNPIAFSDASGLAPSRSGLVPGTTAYKNCNDYSKNTHNYSTGVTKTQHTAQLYSDARTSSQGATKSKPLAPSLASPPPNELWFAAPAAGSELADGYLTYYDQRVNWTKGTPAFNPMLTPANPNANWRSKTDYYTRNALLGGSGSDATGRVANLSGLRGLSQVLGPAGDVAGAFLLYEESLAMYSGTMSRSDAETYALFAQ